MKKFLTVFLAALTFAVVSGTYVPAFATVQTDENTITYTGNGVTTAFSFPYLFYSDTDIVVTVDGVEKTLTTNYTVTGAGDENGGTITFLSAPANGTDIVLQRIVPYEQQTDFENFDGNPADVTEKQFDLVVMQAQQLAEQQERSITVPIGTTLDTNAIAGTIDSTVRVLTITDQGPAASSLTSIDSEMDTAFVGLADGDFLRYNSGNWRNESETTVLSDLDLVTGTNVKTMTNKSLTSPAISSPAISGTLTGSVAQVCQGRLTLTTATPVTTSDVTSAGTVYFTPYTGNKCSLYSSSTWGLYTFSELSISLASGFSSGKAYDVFAYNNSGSMALETLVWTNDTTRATALAFQDGVYVKSGDATRRYLGTFYTTSSTTTEDSEAKRFVWNYYNRVTRNLKKIESTDSWAYSAATWRQSNNSSSNQVETLVGVQEDKITVRAIAAALNSTTALRQLGVAVGLNSTSAPTATAMNFFGSDAGLVSANSFYEAIAPLGRNYFAALEKGNATGGSTQTWYGDNGGTEVQSGIFGTIRN